MVNSESSYPEIATPPLKPCSASDVASFAGLELSLRSHPELSREGSTLNAKSLAKLVESLRSFQHEHLGRAAKTKGWPMVRIPDDIFRDRAKSGPLYQVLLTAFLFKKEAMWRNFDFLSPKRFDDNISLLKKIESKLIGIEAIKRPVIFFDKSVPTKRRHHLEKVVQKFGGSICRDANIAKSGNGFVTHVVAYDPEIDLEEDIKEEEEREKRGEEMDKLFLRTLSIVEPVQIDDNKATKNQSKNKRKRNSAEDKKALIHWWFWPSYYDEWIPASGVEGVNESELPPRPPGGPFLVGCKFLRDLTHFNEWGVEADYAIVDYQKKVDLYRNVSIKSQVLTQNDELSSLEGNKNKDHMPEGIKRNKRKNNKKQKKGSRENRSENSLENVKDGPKMDDTVTSHSSPPKLMSQDRHMPVNFPPKDSPSTNTINKNVKISSKKGGGMNPRQITTGFNSPTGTKIRRTVYDGALRVPSMATDLVKNAIRNLDEDVYKEVFTQKQQYQLVPMNSILMPSKDPAFCNAFTVTLLSKSSSGETKVGSLKVSQSLPGKDNLYRIRGGGGNEMDKSQVYDKDEKSKLDFVHDATGIGKINSNPTDLKQYMYNVSYAHIDGNKIKTESETNVISNHAKVDLNKVSLLSSQFDTSKKLSSNFFVQREISHQSKFSDAVDDVEILFPTKVPITKSKEQTQGKLITIISKESQLDNPKPLSLNINSQQLQTKICDPHLNKSTVSLEIARDGDKLVNKNEHSQGDINKTVLQTSQSTEGKTSFITQPGTQNKSIQNNEISEKVIPLPKMTITSSQGCVKSELNGYDQGAESTEKETNLQTPSWYSNTGISSFEKKLLVEWFNESAPHRTPKLYIETREKIISLSRKNDNKYVTATSVRRSVPGDVGSLLRLFKFLEAWGFINANVTADSTSMPIGHTPTNPYQDSTWIEDLASNHNNNNLIQPWSKERQKLLAISVAQHSSKKRKYKSDMSDDFLIDWKAVAKDMGGDTTASDCQHRFLSIPFDECFLRENSEDRELDHDGVEIIQNPQKFSKSSEIEEGNIGSTRNRDISDKLIYNLTKNIPSDVVTATINAALEASSGNINQAQNASILGAIASKAASNAREQENIMNQLLMEILDQRMAKIENRLALLDDMESIFEAERVALELERRDMYTTRCRHWFGDGN